jgi:hypothetical protein
MQRIHTCFNFLVDEWSVRDHRRGKRKKSPAPSPRAAPQAAPGVNLRRHHNSPSSLMSPALAMAAAGSATNGVAGVYSRPWKLRWMAGVAGAPMAVSLAHRSRGGAPDGGAPPLHPVIHQRGLDGAGWADGDGSGSHPDLV